MSPAYIHIHARGHAHIHVGGLILLLIAIQNVYQKSVPQITFVTMASAHFSVLRNFERNQGDQIWRIFAHWAIVYFGQLFRKLHK
jgi:hypothetical protein